MKTSDRFLARVKNLSAGWERAANIPLAILGIVYLAVYAAQVLNRSNLAMVESLEILANVIWSTYLMDLILRLFASSSLSQFLKRSWLEIISLSIPFIRFLRVFRAVIALRGIHRFVYDRATAAGAYLLMLVPLTWFSGAIAVLDAEAANPEASITTLREALWWSLATITTVGYGDKYPTTLEGQFVAGVLMISGIALFSAGAGMFASWIVGGKDRP